MTTSIDPSVDELLLLEENQYQMSNLVLTNMKPIGAERKIGQSTDGRTKTQSLLVSEQRSVHPTMYGDLVSRSLQEKNNSFEMSSSTIYDHFDFSNITESINPSTSREFESFIYPSCSNYSSRSTSSTSGSSTAHSPRSPSHLLDHYMYQRQPSSVIRQELHHSISSNRIHTGKVIPAFCARQTYPPTRFCAPQHYMRNSSINMSQQTRSTPPAFSAPFHCTRERFQVNSIGRPILRTTTYNYLSPAHHFKLRR